MSARVGLFLMLALIISDDGNDDVRSLLFLNVFYIISKM